MSSTHGTARGDADKVISVTLSPEQAKRAAGLTLDDIASVCDRYEHGGLDEDAREAVKTLQADIAMHVEHLTQINWGQVSEPVTVEWQRQHLERIAKLLMYNAADRMNCVDFQDPSALGKYRDAMREAELGAEIIDQIGATR